MTKLWLKLLCKMNDIKSPFLWAARREKGRSMKLIIDIPNEMFDWLNTDCPNEEQAIYTVDAIRNGTPLEDIQKYLYLEGFHEASKIYHKAVDDIRADIENMNIDCVSSPRLSICKQAALQIINKYIGGKE